MHLTTSAIIVASCPHGETAVIARMLTAPCGLVAAYVAGGRGRTLRPVLMPGNLVMVEIRAKAIGQLPFAKMELLESRGPWLGEPLPAAAIGWSTALVASALPEQEPFADLHDALDGLLGAVCHAGAAREWLRAMIAFEVLVLRSLGFGGGAPPQDESLEALIERFRKQRAPLSRHLFADRRSDILGARDLLAERLMRLI